MILSFSYFKSPHRCPCGFQETLLGSPALPAMTSSAHGPHYEEFALHAAPLGRSTPALPPPRRRLCPPRCAGPDLHIREDRAPVSPVQQGLSYSHRDSHSFLTAVSNGLWRASSLKSDCAGSSFRNSLRKAQRKPHFSEQKV